MKVNLLMTKEKARVLLVGPMVVNMSANGRLVSNMDTVPT